LTSSIRTRQNDDLELNFVSSSGAGSKCADSSESGQGEKELLLCFRPIREGEAVGPELQFCPNVHQNEGDDFLEDLKVSSNQTGGRKKSVSSGTDVPSLEESLSSPGTKKRPPKKRKFQNEEESLEVDETDEKSVIESMMELAKNAQK
jgi:hypothetical protein